MVSKTITVKLKKSVNVGDRLIKGGKNYTILSASDVDTEYIDAKADQG